MPGQDIATWAKANSEHQGAFRGGLDSRFRNGNALTLQQKGDNIVAGTNMFSTGTVIQDSASQTAGVDSIPIPSISCSTPPCNPSPPYSVVVSGSLSPSTTSELQSQLIKGLTDKVDNLAHAQAQMTSNVDRIAEYKVPVQTYPDLGILTHAHMNAHTYPMRPVFYFRIFPLRRSQQYAT